MSGMHLSPEDRAESVLAAFVALADELEQDIADRREDTWDDSSFPISRAEWVGHIAGLSDALAQIRLVIARLTP